MRNLAFIYAIFVLLIACNTPENEVAKEIVEEEIIAADIPKEIVEKKPIEKEEDIKITKPYGKLLYSLNELFIYKNKAALKGKALYDGDAELIQLKAEEESEECKVDYQFIYNPLSLVGNYYSYESWEGGTMACGPQGNSQSVQVINIETLEPVKLTDIFTESSIVNALKKDAWVLGIAEEYSKDLNEINSFDDFVEKIGNSSENKLTANSFAVLDFNKKTNLAAVRLIGTKYMGFNHYEYLQIGMWLEPKDVKVFKNKSYFYLDRFENGVYK